jgi:RecA-family ATPase
VCNIGVILGEASGGLTDADLDCHEAVELAPKVLLETGAVFGRASKPRSHHLYRVAGPAPTIKFLDPTTGKSLLELRGDGGLQTVLPGSVHPSGELIEWAEEGEPATVESAALVEAAKRLAAFCLIRRYLSSVKDYKSLLAALEHCDGRVKRCVCEWLGIGPTSDAPPPDNDDLFKRPVPAHLLESPNRRLTERRAPSLTEGASERPTFQSEPIAEECAQMRRLRDNAANQGRDSWWCCLGVLACCEDGDEFAHAWGSPHPTYSYEETQRELEGWRRNADGATLCETFDKRSPGICETCPHWGKINSPIGLGIQQMDGATGGERTAEGQNGQEGGRHREAANGHACEKLTAIRGDELLSTAAPPRRWLVESFVPASETTMLGGDGGTGKTTLALQLAVGGVTGGDWIGRKVERCNVLYVSAEDPKEEIHYRLEQITKRAKLSNEDLARFRLIDLAGKDATIATFDNKTGLIKPTSLFAQIESAARDHQADCIILDSVADFFGGNENERREVRAFVGLLRGLAMRLGAGVAFLAHPSVDGIKTGRGYSGSTHWNNAVRSRLYFTEAPREEGQLPNLDLRIIELAKSNRARRGEKIYLLWSEGRFIVTSPGAAQNASNETEVEEVFLSLLSRLSRQGVHVSAHRSPSYAPTVFAKQSRGRDFGKAALEGAMHRLIEKEKIRVVEHGPPSKRRHRLVIEGDEGRRQCRALGAV